jgi:hypothetical protein
MWIEKQFGDNSMFIIQTLFYDLSSVNFMKLNNNF